ncbi:Anoctamin-7 [Chamberlinius hualienensis]
MENSKVNEKYELNEPEDGRRTDYGTSSSWPDAEEDTETIVDKEHVTFVDSDDEGTYMTSSTSPTPHESKELYFRDGQRKIDFVLVFEEKKSRYGINDPHQRFADFQREKLDEEKHDKWRMRFFTNLRKIGLDMESEFVENEDRTIQYMKLCAPWAVLIHYAEELNMKARLQAYTAVSTRWTEGVLNQFKLPNMMTQTVPCQPNQYYTCSFKKSKLEKFLGSEDHSSYFTNTQRSRIVYEILQTSSYGKRRQTEIGIDRLLKEGAFKAAFPLHEGPYKSQNSLRGRRKKWNRRQILYEFWARVGEWNKYQPLDHIREYFGEKIAYYFVWLGYYTGWLFPASIVGLLVFFFGLVTMNTNTVAREVCESGVKYKMCPLCNEDDGCTSWHLSDICFSTKAAYLFDNPGTVFYAIFISFWSVFFLEYWKRTSISYAHRWDCFDMDEEEEKPRPQFSARATATSRNPVTDVVEPYFSKKERLKRIVTGFGIVLFMMALVMIFIVAIILYRIIVSIPLFQNPNTRSHADLVSNLTGSVVQLIIILILGKVYEKIAQIITDWEMHRTESQYEDNLTFKVFIFQFVNFYSAVFYIAFFKGRFSGYPGHYNSILGLRPEVCNAGGCLVELAQQLAVIMIGKQVINNTVEVLIPKIKSFFHRRRFKTAKNTLKSRWEEDYELLPYEGLFEEYLEMIIQFGFITIFVAAFPLAPLFAFLNNIVELRLDAQKLICETRRVVAHRAQNIGIWFTILEFLSHIAVISNAFLIAFTSDFLPRLLYMYQYDWNLQGYVNFTLAVAPHNENCRYFDFRDEKGNHTDFYWTLLSVRLAFVIIFEHVVFGLCHLIEVLVPDIPETLEIKIKREKYLARQALMDTDSLMKIAGQVEIDETDEGEPSAVAN